jgi:hypothetical protein
MRGASLAYASPYKYNNFDANSNLRPSADGNLFAPCDCRSNYLSARAHCTAGLAARQDCIWDRNAKG